MSFLANLCGAIWISYGSTDIGKRPCNKRLSSFVKKVPPCQRRQGELPFKMWLSSKKAQKSMGNR